MASLTKAINKDLFDSILPTFGNQRVHIPVWDEGQKMFLCEEYESASGNRYYKGVRFCDRIVVVEKVDSTTTGPTSTASRFTPSTVHALNLFRRETTTRCIATRSSSERN